MTTANIEILFDAIFKNSKDAILTLEPPTWKFTSRNPTALRMFRIPRNMNFSKFSPVDLSPKFQPDGRKSIIKAREMIKIAMDKGTNYFYWTHKRLNGEDFAATVLLTRIDFPEKSFLQATVTDISESKKTAEQLKISEGKFRAIFERAGDGILIADIKSLKLVLANPAMCKMTGYSEDELKEYTIEDIHPKNVHELTKNEFRKQAEGKKILTRNMPMLRKDGTIIYCDINAKPVTINKHKLLLGFFRDVTSRVMDQKKLEESEYLFKESQKLARIGSYKLDIEKDCWNSSSVMDTIFGIKRNYHKSVKGWLNLIYKDDRQMMESYFKNEVLIKHKPFNKKYRIVRPSDNETRWVHGLGHVHYRKSGEPEYMIGTIQDINDQRNQEEHANWLASISRNNPNPIIEYEKAKGIIYSNPVANKMFPTLQKLKLDHPLLISIKNILKQDIDTPISPQEVQMGNKWFFVTFSRPQSGSLRIYATEITQLHNVQDEIIQIKDRDESILESIGDAVFVVDTKGKIILFNRVAAELTKIPKEQAIGRNYLKIVSFVKESDGRNCNQFIADAIKNNKITAMSNHVMLERKDGTRIPVADCAAPVKESRGNMIGCVVIFHDMTKEYKIDKAKTEFVSLASHQLRTPLSTINWYSEILLSEDLGKLSEQQRRYSQEVYHASQRMVQLVNALLNVSRLELGTFSVEPKFVNVINILTTSISELKPQIHAKKLVITEIYDSNIAMVKVDPKLMGMIFQNLLSNAVKYSKPQGKIEVKISAKNDSMLISIADTGIGIPKGQQKEIFTKLFRADNAKSIDPDGTGLGLYIVKEIINYTGGKVWFTSSEGKGTTFYASLPMSGMVKKTSNKQLI